MWELLWPGTCNHPPIDGATAAELAHGLNQWLALLPVTLAGSRTQSSGVELLDLSRQWTSLAETTTVLPRSPAPILSSNSQEQRDGGACVQGGRPERPQTSSTLPRHNKRKRPDPSGRERELDPEMKIHPSHQTMKSTGGGGAAKRRKSEVPSSSPSPTMVYKRKEDLGTLVSPLESSGLAGTCGSFALGCPGLEQAQCERPLEPNAKTTDCDPVDPLKAEAPSPPQRPLDPRFSMRLQQLKQQLKQHQNSMIARIEHASTKPTDQKKAQISTLRKLYVGIYERFASECFSFCFGKQLDMIEAFKRGRVSLVDEKAYSGAEVQELSDLLISEIALRCKPEVNFLTPYKGEKIRLAVIFLRTLYINHLCLCQQGFEGGRAECERRVRGIVFKKGVVKKLRNMMTDYAKVAQKQQASQKKKGVDNNNGLVAGGGANDGNSGICGTLGTDVNVTMTIT